VEGCAGPVAEGNFVRMREREKERKREREKEREQAMACGGCEATGQGAHPRVVRIVRRERAEQRRRLSRPGRALPHTRALPEGAGV